MGQFVVLVRNRSQVDTCLFGRQTQLEATDQRFRAEFSPFICQLRARPWAPRVLSRNYDNICSARGRITRPCLVYLDVLNALARCS
jgi:hypothetical protein